MKGRNPYLLYQKTHKFLVKALKQNKQNKTKQALKTEIFFAFGKKVFASGGKGGQVFHYKPYYTVHCFKTLYIYFSRIHKFKDHLH